MAHAVVARTTRLDIYFCDPHSPWQRATTVAIAHHNSFHLILIASRIA